MYLSAVTVDWSKLAPIPMQFPVPVPANVPDIPGYPQPSADAPEEVTVTAKKIKVPRASPMPKWVLIGVPVGLLALYLLTRNRSRK